MNKIAIILLLMVIMSCQSEPADKQTENFTRDSNIQVQKETINNQRGVNTTIENQIQQDQASKSTEDQDIAIAKQKKADLERESELRNLEFEKQENERRLREKQAYSDNIEHQRRENLARQKKNEDDLKALQRQQQALDKSTTDMIDKVRKSSQ